MLEKISNHNKKFSTRVLRITKFYSPSYVSENKNVTMIIGQTTNINVDGILLDSYIYMYLDNSSKNGIVEKIFFCFWTKNDDDLKKVRNLNFLSKFKRLIFHKYYLDFKYKHIPDGKRVHRYIFEFKDANIYKIDGFNDNSITIKFNKIPSVSMYKLNNIRKTGKRHNPKNKLCQNGFYMDIYLEVEE